MIVRILGTCVGTGTIFFGSFALGAAFGPGPLTPVELGIGLLATLLTGTGFALPLAFLALRRGRIWGASVLEGGRRLRVSIFPGYVLLGREVVMLGLVKSVELDGDALVLRYVDAKFSGVVLRELNAARDVLSGMAALLSGPH